MKVQPMFPDLMTLGPLTLHSYGVATVMGWFLGVLVLLKRRHIAGLSQDDVMDLSFYCVLGAILGARVLYVIVEWDFYRMNLSEIWMVHRGGLVFYGGFMGSVAILAWQLHRRSLPVGAFADAIAPAIALGHGVGRIGCFLNGCCYGREGTFLACHFPFLGDPEGFRRLPIQLWEAGLCFALAAFLWSLPAAQMAKGRIFALYVGAYGAFRFGFEFLRDDPRGMIADGFLSTSQGLAIVAIAGSAVIWILAGKKAAL